MIRYLIGLLVAAAAATSSVLCWLQVRTLVEVAPVSEGQPGTVSVVYHPPLMLLAWLLAVVAGVLAVLAVAGLVRHRRA